MTDQILAKRICEKDEEAFEELYYKYHDLVYYIILQIVHNVEIAKELVQETFLKIYLKITQYEGGNLKYWILQIAKHESLNYVTREQKKDNNVIVNNDIIASTIDNTFSIGKLDDLLTENFDPESKEIIILKIVFDYTFDEIVEEMGLSKGYVYRKYKSSLSKLKFLVKEMK